MVFIISLILIIISSILFFVIFNSDNKESEEDKESEEQESEEQEPGVQEPGVQEPGVQEPGVQEPEVRAPRCHPVFNNICDSLEYCSSEEICKSCYDCVNNQDPYGEDISCMRVCRELYSNPDLWSQPKPCIPRFNDCDRVNEYCKMENSRYENGYGECTQNPDEPANYRGDFNGKYDSNTNATEEDYVLNEIPQKKERSPYICGYQKESLSFNKQRFINESELKCPGISCCKAFNERSPNGHCVIYGGSLSNNITGDSGCHTPIDEPHSDETQEDDTDVENFNCDTIQDCPIECCGSISGKRIDSGYGADLYQGKFCKYTATKFKDDINERLYCFSNIEDINQDIISETYDCTNCEEPPEITTPPPEITTPPPRFRGVCGGKYDAVTDAGIEDYILGRFPETVSSNREDYCGYFRNSDGTIEWEKKCNNNACCKLYDIIEADDPRYLTKRQYLFNEYACGGYCNELAEIPEDVTSCDGEGKLTFGTCMHKPDENSWDKYGRSNNLVNDGTNCKYPIP